MTARRVRWSQLSIGLSVTTIVTALAGVIFFIDDFRNAIEERYTLYFNTYTNQTLSRRAPVWLAGQPVGEVRAVRFSQLEPGQTELLSVELAISFAARPFITDGAEVQLTTAGLLGEAVVNILPASQPGAPLPDGAVLPAAYVIDPQEAARHLKSVYDSLPPVKERWLEVLDQAAHGPGTISRLRQRPDELRQLQLNLTEIAATFDTVSRAADGLGELFAEPDVRAALKRIGPRVAALADSWSDGGGSVSGFAADTTIAAHLEGILRRVEAVSGRLDSGRGTLGRLLNDEVLFQELERTRQMLRELRGELDRS